MPKISVIIPVYNQEKHIAQAIESVLEQTYQDFEIIITDDGSTDGTVKEIRKFGDSRIKLLHLETNQGVSVAVNSCINEAKGEFIALLNSDDIFLPDKLEKQIKFLGNHPDIPVVFGYAKIIDEDGNDFTDKNHFYYNVFNQPNRTRHEWLNHFFYKGNCLCHPSILARQDVYRGVQSDPRLTNSEDLDRWIKICLKYDIYIIQEDLIKFRIREGESNLSGNRPEAINRGHIELLQVFRNYLKIETADELLKIFPEASKYCDQIERDMIPFSVAMIAFETGTCYPLQQIFAINVLYDLLKDKNMAEKIKTKCGFGYPDFFKMTGMYDLFNIEKSQKLAERDQKIHALMNSYSWKVTKPLRWLLKRW